jgi:hypothetical protein
MVANRGIWSLVLPALLAGCGFHQPVKEMMDVRARPAMAKEAPSDILVLPLMDDSGHPRAQVVLPQLRRAIYRALIGRCYSPLSLGHLDQTLQKDEKGRVLSLAALRGKFDEDAILQVRLTAWSERKFFPDRRLMAAAEVSLVSSASGEELLGGRLETEVEVPGHGGIPRDQVEQMRLRAVHGLAQRIVSGFPRRSELVTK